MAAPALHRTFTATEYERMIAVGILTEDEQIELVGGEIYRMSPIGARHAHIVTVLSDLTWAQVGRTAYISVQNPIRLDDLSVPQSDIAVLRRRNYAPALARPADVLLVIEVAESSRDYDRGTKLPRYAAAGIAEAWLVDLVTETVERYTEPRNGHYRQITIGHAGDTLTSTVLAELMIPVDAVLGIGDAP